MSDANAQPRKAGPRDLYFFAHPDRWPTWPFLPVVRHRGGGEDPDLGVLYDCRHVNGRLGYAATVFLTNLFTMPSTEAEFFGLPKEVFDTFEELAAAGWVVD